MRSLRDVANLAYALLLLAYALGLETLWGIAPLLPKPKIPAGKGSRPADTNTPRRNRKDVHYVGLIGKIPGSKRKLKKLLSQSKADFLILQTQHNDPQPLIDQALKTKAFATARQIAYTGWRTHHSTNTPSAASSPEKPPRLLLRGHPKSLSAETSSPKLGVPNATT